MSHDLYLYRRPDQPPLERGEFVAAFAGRKHYKLTGDTAGHSEPDTGVSFVFTWCPGGDGEGFRARPYVHFNMNYGRPHWFGDEAAPTLWALVRKLNAAVSDPQGGIEGEEFSEEGFLAGWNKGNAAAHKALGALGLLRDKPRWPAATGRMFWSWNYQREDINEDLMQGDNIDVFVPRIMYFIEGGQPKTFCIFPDLVPTAIPRVDRVLVGRARLEGGLAQQSKQAPGWVAWDELRSALPGFEVREFEDDCPPLPYLVLYDAEAYPNNKKVPDELARWVLGLPDWPGGIRQIGPADILDEELLGR
jgi:hypothetical protein